MGTRRHSVGLRPHHRDSLEDGLWNEDYKEGRALHPETTINDTRDFNIGKRLKNPPALRKVGFQPNRRLLDVERISHDCAIGEDAFNTVRNQSK